MEPSFWQNLADNAPEEQTGFKGEDLPINAWVVMDTATSANGKAAPEIRVQDSKKGPITKFNVGLIAVGGDSKVNAELHNRRMLYMDLFVYPGEKEIQHNAGAILGGRLTGFLNAVFASGVAEDEKDAKARSKKRWAKTTSVLAQTAQTTGLSLEQYNGDTALYIAGVAVQALKDNSKRLIAKTADGTYEKGGAKIAKVEVGAFEDFTVENQSNRKVSMFAVNPATY